MLSPMLVPLPAVVLFAVELSIHVLWWTAPRCGSRLATRCRSGLPAAELRQLRGSPSTRWRSSERWPLTSFVGGRQILQRSDFDHFGRADRVRRLRSPGTDGLQIELSQLVPRAISVMTLEGSFDAVSIVRTGPTSAALIGELDMAGTSAVQDELALFDGDILLDCSGLSFIDLAGLRILIDTDSTCQTRAARLVLENPSPCLVRLLELTNLQTRFNVSSHG